MPVQYRAPSEYFVSSRSFSEVKETKELLEGLSRRWLAELRQQREAVGLLSMRSRKGWEPDARQVTQAIADLEQAIAEFRGTGHERILVRDLFILLRNRGHSEKWLNLYLRLLYENPTEELVGALANDALTIAKDAGRQGEVCEAFQHLTGIPFEFESKAQIQTVGTW